MHCLLSLFSCLLLLILVEAIDFYSIEKDLAEYNVTCYQEKCEGYRSDSLATDGCHCGLQCYQLNTCCLSSNYVSVPQPKLKRTCRSTINTNSFYFLVDQCPSDSIWADLCNNDWNGDDDVQKFIPVTSLLTSITYKNYYCFRCHETNDDYLYWILKVESEFTHYDTSETSEQPEKQVSLMYNKDWETWMAIYDEKIGYFPVYLSLEIPPKVDKLAHNCEPNVISDCSPGWPDEEVKNKCQSYMALKEVKRDGGSLKYRNIHCALCNFENLKDIGCRAIVAGSFGGKRPFSFTYLLDINRSDGEFVGKKQKCPDDHVWDRYAETCRKLTCALPGYNIKNGKCVQN